jgi:hypothetical protein
LSALEERLVALRIPFMQIRAVGSERQSKLDKNVVNVENDLDVCSQVLPRSFDDSSTVYVEFMRQMCGKPYMKEVIRPAKVFKAAQYLMTTDAYLAEDVTLSDDWQGYTNGKFYNTMKNIFISLFFLDVILNLPLDDDKEAESDSSGEEDTAEGNITSFWQYKYLL